MGNSATLCNKKMPRVINQENKKLILHLAIKKKNHKAWKELLSSTVANVFPTITHLKLFQTGTIIIIIIIIIVVVVTVIIIVCFLLHLSYGTV